MCSPSYLLRQSSTIAACALLFLACSSSGSIRSGEPSIPYGVEEVVELSRGACYGPCPVYRIKLYEDGTIQYHGEAHVKTGGAAWVTVSSAVVDQVRDELETSGVRLLDNDCCDCRDATDMPTATLRIRWRDSEIKEVRHYHGCMAAPDWLSRLEDWIDERLRTKDFIGTESERDSLAGRG